MPSLNHYSNVRSVLAAALFFLMACSSSQKGGQGLREKVIPISIPEGIAGSIVFKQGAFDATDKLSSAEGVLYGVERKIYIYSKTNIKAADLAEGDFVNHIHEQLIDSMQSNQDGYFQKEIKPGNYSLFILENNRLYSKLDEAGYYYPVRVSKDSVSMVKLEIDHKAIY